MVDPGRRVYESEGAYETRLTLWKEGRMDIKTRLERLIEEDEMKQRETGSVVVNPVDASPPITEEMAAQIKKMLRDNFAQHYIAACFNINQGRVSEIATGKAFSHVRPAEELTVSPPTQKALAAAAAPSEATAARLTKAPVFRGVIGRFPRAMLAIARVSQSGTIKHQVPIDDYSFTSQPMGTFDDAVGRHQAKLVIEGPINLDPKDHDGFAEGHLHRAHMAWNALAALEVELMAREASGVNSNPTVPKPGSILKAE